jgi:hypothetical protein
VKPFQEKGSRIFEAEDFRPLHLFEEVLTGGVRNDGVATTGRYLE